MFNWERAFACVFMFLFFCFSVFSSFSAPSARCFHRGQSQLFPKWRLVSFAFVLEVVRFSLFCLCCRPFCGRLFFFSTRAVLLVCTFLNMFNLSSDGPIQRPISAHASRPLFCSVFSRHFILIFVSRILH